jgi:hypothetical protein
VFFERRQSNGVCVRRNAVGFGAIVVVAVGDVAGGDMQALWFEGIMVSELLVLERWCHG